MPVRGRRSAVPMKGKSPTGMFRSPQKKDSTSKYDTGLVKYAQSGGGETAGKPGKK